MATPTGDYKWVNVPPIPTHRGITSDFHDQMGHLGRDKLVDSLREWYWWPGMSIDTAHALRACKACAKDHPGGEPKLKSGTIHKGD